MSISVGNAAPDFTLYNSEKEQVTLSSFKGKNVLLLFFPQSFTGVCTEELCSTRDNLSRYNGLNTEVLAISVDSVFTLEKFKESEGLNFMLLSDFNKEVSTAYDTIYHDWIFDMKGVSKRSAFVIDASGDVQYAEVLEVPSDLPDFEAINSCLAGLS